MAGGPRGLTRYADLVAPLQAMGEAWRYDSLITTTAVDVILNLASTIVAVIPVWGPLLVAGVQFVVVLREGNQDPVALVDLAEAKASASAFGQARVISAEDRAAAERGEFVLATVSGVFDVVQTAQANALGRTANAGDAPAPPPAVRDTVPTAPAAGASATPPPAGRAPAGDPSATLAPPSGSSVVPGMPDPSATLAPPGRGAEWVSVRPQIRLPRCPLRAPVQLSRGCPIPQPLWRRLEEARAVSVRPPIRRRRSPLQAELVRPGHRRRRLGRL